jgi:hypothetical protein
MGRAAADKEKFDGSAKTLIRGFMGVTYVAWRRGKGFKTRH